MRSIKVKHTKMAKKTPHKHLLYTSADVEIIARKDIWCCLCFPFEDACVFGT